MGNIATFSAPGKGIVTYTYDNQGQLLSAAGDTTYTYTYDGAGNILTASDGTVTHSYTYGDASWKDLLTAFNGQSITYDSIGNPTSYFNGTRWNFTWVNGRSLATASDGTNSLSFAYDASGLRTSKTVNGTTYRYYYAGGKLMRMSWEANIVDFFYDANGAPYAMKYNGTVYYYITNLQGDVMRIVDASQNIVTSYDYDPYGKVISATGTLANINPLRYRGYVYDTETGLYYVSSRYYDPEIGRFISADEFTSTGQGTVGCNMFAYCGNNPVSRVDYCGHFWDTAFDIVSLCFSIAEVAANPADLWAWAGLAGDIVDLVPFVTGVGETTKAVGATVKVANAVDNTYDTIKIVKAADFTDDALDAIRSLDKVGNATRSTASAGRRIHKGYKTGYEFVEGMTKEAVRGKNRLDFLDDVNKIIYELKPNNPRGLRDGIRQLQRYNNTLGGGYKLLLELY